MCTGMKALTSLPCVMFNTKMNCKEDPNSLVIAILDHKPEHAAAGSYSSTPEWHLWLCLPQKRPPRCPQSHSVARLVFAHPRSAAPLSIMAADRLSCLMPADNLAVFIILMWCSKLWKAHDHQKEISLHQEEIYEAKLISAPEPRNQNIKTLH